MSTDVTSRMMSELGIELPDDLSLRLEKASAPHLERAQRMLSECRSFMDHYRFLVDKGELHPESAVELIKHSDLLRFNLIEPIADMESLLVMAEYAAFNAADGKTVELKRKQAEAWVQPFHRLHKIMQEYAQWLDRVSFTLRAIARRGD